MKKIITKYSFLYLLFCLASVIAWGQSMKDIVKRPEDPNKLVHDYAGVLSPSQKQYLEDKLKRYDDSTSNNIAVVLVKTLDGYSIEDAATELFRNWGIGQKKTNNGILLLAAINDKKIRIEAGYGLEGAVTDYIASEIIDNDIKPNFRAQNYYEGIESATNDIIKAAEGRYKAPEGYNKRGQKGGGSFVRLMVMMFIIFIILAVISRKGGGGNNGGMMSRRGYRDWTPPIIINWGGGGSSGGGGGWSGGGGGGFGGFGGGSSGGGGASGDW
jgi:uncharacterized protein